MNRSVKGNLVAFFTVLVWGTTFITTKILLQDFLPVEILFTRFVMGLLALFAAYPHRLKFLGMKKELTLMLAAITGVTLYYLLENMALTYTYASNVGVLVSVSPCMTAVLAYYVLKTEPLKPTFFVGFFIAICGIVLISLNGSENLGLNPRGDILAIIACFMWAVYSVTTKKMGEWNINNVQITRRTFLYGTIFMLPFAVYFGYRPKLELVFSLKYLPSFLYLGLVASAACFATWNIAIKLLGAVKTSIYIYLIPVITVIMSFFVLHEKITSMAFVGTALTLLGLFISEGRLNLAAFKRKKA